jgi:hypothetical protein
MTLSLVSPITSSLMASTARWAILSSMLIAPCVIPVASALSVVMMAAAAPVVTAAIAASAKAASAFASLIVLARCAETMAAAGSAATALVKMTALIASAFVSHSALARNAAMMAAADPVASAQRSSQSAVRPVSVAAILSVLAKNVEQMAAVATVEPAQLTCLIVQTHSIVLITARLFAMVLSAVMMAAEVFVAPALVLWINALMAYASVSLTVWVTAAKTAAVVLVEPAQWKHPTALMESPVLTPALQAALEVSAAMMVAAQPVVPAEIKSTARTVLASACLTAWGCNVVAMAAVEAAVNA